MRPRRESADRPALSKRRNTYRSLEARWHLRRYAPPETTKYTFDLELELQVNAEGTDRLDSVFRCEQLRDKLARNDYTTIDSRPKGGNFFLRALRHSDKCKSKRNQAVMQKNENFCCNKLCK